MKDAGKYWHKKLAKQWTWEKQKKTKNVVKQDCATKVSNLIYFNYQLGITVEDWINSL